ncbi:cell division cycle-associated protein 2 [Scomber scombrus]|uniref:cell division cycle-associated protein 2 n=1 Tax=Scomber scombrus TaxID=13677 RepID=UPI002DD7F16E|nr:cell division cycle-associated protein 2 [Scomber scombrus]
MSTIEMNTTGTEGDQRMTSLPPSEEDTPPVINDISALLNFGELTPSQFGISVQSFTPASSDRKDKSRVAQIKARRRSSVGVRGSPETNSLIRFMAQQRMKTPKSQQTPELVKSSPLLPRVASTLRQKMASFQCLMDVEESEVCDPMPRQDNNTGGCIKTRDYLSDGENLNGGKENLPPMMTPTPNKRRRVGPLEGCKIEIREARAPVLLNFKQQEEDVDPVKQAVTKGPLPSRETVQEAQAVLISPPVQAEPLVFPELQACSSTNSQQDGVFELQSPRRPPSDDLAAASPAKPALPFLIPSLPSLLQMKPTGEDGSSATSTIKKKKKQVRFGGPLSPEFFDKNLPPSTPLQKGATPARAATPGGSLKLRSLLKTPQKSESQSLHAQPDFCSPTEFGASPTLAMPRNRRMQCVGEDREEVDGKIVFPSMDEIDSAGATDTEPICDTQPLNLDTAFHEESLCEILTESVNKPSTTSKMDTLDEPVSLPEEEKQLEADIEAPAPSRSSNRRKKSEPKSESATEAPARSRSRKRKQPEETEPVKRSTRTAAKSASGKMKMTATATRRFNKEVNRSLYGSREYASKDPTLSPIAERLSFISQSLTEQLTDATSCTTSNQETYLTNEVGESVNHPVTEVVFDTQEMSDITVTNASETPSEASITSAKSSKESTKGKGRRLSGPRVRGLKRMKVSMSEDDLFIKETQDQTGEKRDKHCEDKTTANLESTETSLKQTVPDQEGVDTETLYVQTSADTPCTDSDGKPEYYASLDAPTSACPPLCEESNSLSVPTEPAQSTDKRNRGRPRGRRSSAYSSVQPEQGNHAEKHQTSHDVEEKGDEAASQQENNNGSNSDSQGEWEVANLDLAPWQVDFNFEDVFKPVATRGNRSVRRSMRNKGNAENSIGLAWLPQTPPDSIKEARRRTRSRRLCAAIPVQPSLPEETQHNAS